MQNDVPVYEYSPNEIKKALTGYGAADKAQMEEVVKMHLGLKEKPKPDDAADALAAAITCGFYYREGPTVQKYEFSNTRGKKYSRRKAR